MALIEFTPDSSGSAGSLTVTKTVSAASAILVVGWSGTSAYTYSCTVAGAGAGVAIGTKVSSQGGKAWAWLVENVSSGSCAVVMTEAGPNNAPMVLQAYELTSAPTSSALDAIGSFEGVGSAVYAAESGGIAVTAGSIVVAAYIADRTTTLTATGYTALTAAAIAGGWEPHPLTQTFAGGASGERATGNVSPNAWTNALLVAIKQAAAGVTFDAAGNSGAIAAASSYSGSASWAGADRMLSIDVAMLGPGVTVSAMTYGGAACTFVGAISTVTSFGRVEQWRICSSDSGAPAAGSNTLAVTLTGSLEFAVGWVSRTGVHQTVPVEAFNSAQATNAGSATNASVTITSVADNCVIHSATVANDTSIAAGQTSRNNVSGTLGSGLNEDSGATPVTPAGATSMTATGMGITTTWAIAGYAVRPLAASGAATKAPAAMLNLLLGAH